MTQRSTTAALTTVGAAVDAIALPGPTTSGTSCAR